MSSENWIDLTSESGAGPVEEGQSAPTTSQATLPTSSIAPPTAPQQVNPVQDSGAKHTSKLIRVRVGDGEPSSFISHGQPSSGSIVAAAPQTHRTLPPTAGGVSYIQAAMPTTSTSFPIPSIPTVQPPVVYNPQAMGGQPLPPTQLFQNPQIPGIVQPPSQYAFPRPVNVMPPMNPPYNNVLYNNPNANKVYNGDLINSFKANNANLLSVPQIPQQIPQYTPQPQMIAQPRQNPYVLPNPHYQPPRPPQQVAVMAPQPTAFQRNMQMHQHPPQQQTYDAIKVTFTLLNPEQFTARVETGNVSKDILKICIRVPGSKFDMSLKRWIFPITSLQILQTAFSQRRCHVVSIPQSILNAVQLGSNANNNILAQNSEAVDNVLKENGLCDKIMGNLAAFQREAVHFVISKNGRALIADEMGLGKTRTAIAAACVYREDWPVLVVCPSSARHHWQSEILQIIPEEMLTPREVTVVDNGHHPLDSKTSQFQYKIIIISYSLVAKMHHLLATIPFNVIIADESHYIKNMNSQRCKCLVPMLQKSRRAILLSGTPALSRPFELFTQLKALDEKTWSDVKDFGRRYCQDARPTKKKSVYNSHNRNSSWKTNIFKGANNTKELHLLLTSTVMIRRLKNDILKQLPPKKRFLMKITIEDQEKKKQFQAMLATLQQYEELAKRKKPKRMAAFLLDEEEEGGGNDFADTEKETGDVAEENIKVQKKRYLLELFDQSGIAKVPAILKHLGKFLDEEFTGKILIFAHHKAVLDQISAFLQEREVEFIRIDGRTASKDRHQLTQKFQNDSNTRAAVLGITAAGIALTLTAASTVFFAELYWTPGSLIQAEDRAHRIGQVRVVNVFYFFAENSIDEILWPLVRKKMKLLGEFVEGHHDADIGALLFTGKKGAQGKQESQEESKPSASSEEVDNDRKDNVASSSSSSQKVKNETDGVEVIEIDLDDEKAPNVFSVVQDEREEELTELVQEMAEEEKEKITKKESEGKKKAEEDEDDDEEEDDEEDEYKDYLNSSDPPDQLALAFLAYLQRKQEKAAMQAAQAANAQAIVDRSQGKSKDCCISLLDDEDEPPSTVPAASSSETANKNLAPAKSAVISLLDDDDEIAKPPANGKPALSNEDIFGDDVKIKNEHVEEISSNMEVPEDVQNVASSNGIVDLSFEEDFNKPKAATTTPPDPDVMQPIMMEGAPQHFYWQGGMLPVANQQFQNFPIYQFSPQLLPSAPQTYLPDPHQFIPHGFDPSFGGGTQHIYMPSSFGNAMWQPEENATPGEQLSPLPPQSDSNNNSNPTGN